MSNPAVDKLIDKYAEKVGPAYKGKVVVNEMVKILVYVPASHVRAGELLSMAHQGLEQHVKTVTIGPDQTDSFKSDKNEITLEQRADTADMAYGLLFETFNAVQCQEWVALENSFDNRPSKGFLDYGKEKADIEAVTLMHYMELVRVVKLYSALLVFPDAVSRQLTQCAGISHLNRHPSELKVDYRALMAKTPHDSKAQQKKERFHYLSMTSPEVAAFDACRRMSMNMASAKLQYVIKNFAKKEPPGLVQFMGKVRSEWVRRAGLDDRIQLPWLWLRAGMEANHHLDLELDGASLWFTDDMCVHALRVGGRDWWYEPPGKAIGTPSKQRKVGKLKLRPSLLNKLEGILRK